MTLSYIYLESFYSFLSMLRLPSSSTLFPYTTLFRSLHVDEVAFALLRHVGQVGTEHELLDVLDTRVAGHRPRLLPARSEEHTSELQSLRHLVCRLLLEKKKNK